MSSIPGSGTKNPHAKGQLSLCDLVPKSHKEKSPNRESCAPQRKGSPHPAQPEKTKHSHRDKRCVGQRLEKPCVDYSWCKSTSENKTDSQIQTTSWWLPGGSGQNRWRGLRGANFRLLKKLMGNVTYTIRNIVNTVITTILIWWQIVTWLLDISIHKVYKRQIAKQLKLI